MIKRLIATVAVCGVSLFGFTAVGDAAGFPGTPTPNGNAIPPGQACIVVSAHNPLLVPAVPPNRGVAILEEIGGGVFCV